jgi:hypothetical protein
MSLLERAMDFGDGAMLAVAQRADEGDDVKAKLAVGQGPGVQRRLQLKGSDN